MIKLRAQLYRKKPVVIEAFEWTGHSKNIRDLKEFCPIIKMELNSVKDYFYYELTIPTLEGDHRVDLGDFIIKGVAGEFYPCKPEIFWATYERVEE